MGLDAQVYVEGNLVMADVWFDLVTHVYPASAFEPIERVQVEGMNDSHTGWHNPMLDRWYGIEYERGDWPMIYTLIRMAQAQWPSATVYYGNDSGAQVVTPELLEELWAHYLGPHGIGD